MARFSPRDPGFTSAPTLGDALASLARSGGAAQEAVEEREDLELQRDEIARLRDVAVEDRERELFEAGFTRTPRREQIPEEEDIFAGVLPGLETADPRRRAPDVFQGAGIGMQPDTTPAAGALGQLEQTGQVPPEQPQLLAVPGAYVEGMGFTPRTITDMDLVQERRKAMRQPRTRLAPGVEQVTEDLFFDEARSPAGRERRAEEEATSSRRARLEAVLSAVQAGGEEGDIPPEILAEGLDIGVPSGMLRPGRGEEPGMIRVQGRDFPNTEAGERAALAWREALAEAGRTGGRSGGAAERITGEVTRRTLATAAARAMDRIRQDVRDLSPYERRNLEPGQIETQIRETLELFGFASPQELESEMRELRLAGTGRTEPGAGAGGAGQAGELSDAEIDAIIEANPDLSDEEILALIERGG